jgi:3-oxoacyl-[acyl-carrier protein] reductase
MVSPAIAHWVASGVTQRAFWRALGGSQMDLQLKGLKAIVGGAETPLSRACAAALLTDGAHVTLVSSVKNLQEIDRDLAVEGGAEALRSVTADIADAAGIDLVMAACPQPDIVVNHAAGLPPGDFRVISPDDWLEGVRRIMLPGILLSTRVYDGMVERGFGRIVNITSQCVKAAMEGLDISNAARSGFTGFSAGLARYPHNVDVTINGLLPGLFDTPALRSHAASLASKQGREIKDVVEELSARSPLGRIGVPREFGSLCAFICSPLAGYINGQNILVDGGAYPGVL